MALSRSLAWSILGLAFFTAGLLRHFHDRVYHSPYVLPAVGSLVFAAIFLLLLVAARERRLDPPRETTVRIGTLAPILLMLLVEKWVSMTLYAPLFSPFPSEGVSDAEMDARYRAFAGLALLLVCVLLAGFSPVAAQRTWRRSRPIRWLPAAAGTATVVVVAYLLLAAASAALGGGLSLEWPSPDRALLWIVGGQALRAFAEEVYYRGLLLSEMERLAPRLGVRSPAARRWASLIPTAALFSLEHITDAPPWAGTGREAIFTFSLGLLLGILVLVTNNLHFAAGVHVYVNWLLLAAAPRFVDWSGQPALPPGTYVGLVLILAFVFSFVTQKPDAESRE